MERCYKIKVKNRFLKGVEFEFNYSGFRKALEYGHSYAIEHNLDDRKQVLVCCRKKY